MGAGEEGKRDKRKDINGVTGEQGKEGAGKEGRVWKGGRGQHGQMGEYWNRAMQCNAMQCNGACSKRRTWDVLLALYTYRVVSDWFIGRYCTVFRGVFYQQFYYV